MPPPTFTSTSAAKSTLNTRTNVFTLYKPRPHFSLASPSGWGVKKVSVLNMKTSQYVPIHSKQIRSLSFNQQNDSLMLSAALDGTIKLTRCSV